MALTLSQAGDARRAGPCRSSDGSWLERRREHTAPTECARCASDSRSSGLARTRDCGPFSSWELSRRRYRALLIGIGYRDADFLDHLRGAVTDVQEMYALVTDHIGFNSDDVRVLADEPLTCQNPVAVESPTKANIFSAMTWLVDGASAGDSCFFFFAGHGHHMIDVDGDEISGMDQVLIPIDFKSAGCILDDLIYERLVRGVAPGVRLTAVVDACKSGTVLDLPFLYQYPEVLTEATADSALVSIGDQAGTHTRALMTTEGDVPRYRKRAGHGVGEVVLFSGVADSQNATDAPIDGTAISMGIFTQTFISELKEMLTGNEPRTYGALLDKIKESVVARVGEVWDGQASQVPQMSSSYRFDIYSTIFAI
jgi:metacaspase-1